jgi:hypothetical protein
MRLHIRLAAIAAFVLWGAGCDEPLSSITGPTPDLKPTFSSIQQNIFEAGDSSGRVACTNCHTTARANFVGGLDLTTGAAYAALVNTSARNKPGAVRVVPADPDASYVIHKLEGRSTIAGQRMPLGGPYLTEGQIAVIRRWIELGARND